MLLGNKVDKLTPRLASPPQIYMIQLEHYSQEHKINKHEPSTTQRWRKPNIYIKELAEKPMKWIILMLKEGSKKFDIISYSACNSIFDKSE